MVAALAAALSALPVLLGACLGRRAGIREILGRAAAILVPWTAGVLTAGALFRAGSFEPFGLITPVAVGLAVFAGAGLAVLALLRRRKGGRAAPGLVGSFAGAVAGASAGAYVSAVLWIALALAEGVRTAVTEPVSPNASAGTGEDLLSALVRTAHQGFVRHVPVIGPIGDEVEAARQIIRARREDHERLRRDLGLEPLADLPSARAIAADRDLLDDIDRLGEGDLSVLYRLQKDRRIIAFWEEPAVREKVMGLRPSGMARRIVEYRKESGRKESR